MDAPQLADLTRQMRIVRLGQGVDARGYLDPAAISRAVEATVEYQRMIEKLGATSIRFRGDLGDARRVQQR